MNFNNKILLVFLILMILLLLVFSHYSNATDSTNFVSLSSYQFPELPSDFDNFKYKVICYNSETGDYDLYVSSYSQIKWCPEELCNRTEHTGPCLVLEYGGYNLNSIVKCYRFNPSTNNSWVLIRTWFDTDLSYYTHRPYDECYYNLVYSNEDIHVGDHKWVTDTVVFYKVPLFHSTTAQTFVGANILQTVMPLIPACLIIFSIIIVVFLVPYVLRRFI